MVSIEVIIRDDHGNILEMIPPQPLELGHQTLHEIEGAVEQWKQTVLPGKTIGSGRMEKAVDQVIGRRQKRKGCSWRPLGSHALAVLKVTELNHHWHQAFFQDIS